jgi:hypothetical protein
VSWHVWRIPVIARASLASRQPSKAAMAHKNIKYIKNLKI